ncbi:antirestriction protein [[Haemophilus] ducreyi]|uniref:DNA primase n=2 Tax=Haemophilus ducreyi TaxID=730 RepID=Q7VMQ6_HAEDU|nr:zincin-like metallopeptidase domain-containing protein [[Haemophilus] ducreyi]AAP95800.1 putative DNA primase [[Haemophilus] ducreyi 35000HP]AKO30842.1 antirestriction protein [[Haemophilus] ducreyi]AKO32280.1 antirestriction protein [[Haemophilus] ducreyi]AKO33734.1 antirestriction protein [[Haemophilus] ducreyi]AKO35182.1 antirestriction protein [[Haemophilus] ducreyi]
MKKYIQPQPKDLYQQITDQIIDELKTGTMPWIRPWDNSSPPMVIPCNGETGRHYSGINILLLWMSTMRQKFTQRKWVTFQGAQHLGGKVRVGEKSTVIIFYKQTQLEETDDEGNVVFDENGEPKMKTSIFIQGHHVFNIEQCDGLEKCHETFPEHKPNPNKVARPELDELPINMGMQVYNRLQSKACYIPARDCIIMPDFKKFHSADDYYATLLHECGHATGHKDRLDRDGVTRFDKFGSEQYAFEELIAELTSAFTCANVGVANNISQNAAYIDHWIQMLKSDKKAIFRASSQAREATQYLLDIFHNEEQLVA